MWQLEVPPISARRSLERDRVELLRPSSAAPSSPRPPACASMIETPTGVPGGETELARGSAR